MLGDIIQGNLYSQNILAQLAAQVRELPSPPSLCVLKVGHNPASEVYVEKKRATAEKLGFKSQVIALPETVSQAELLHLIETLNQEKETHGILIQMPLPASLDTDAILEAIAPVKDVDGLHPLNLGRLAGGKTDGLVPCTPQGILHLLKPYHPQLKGLKAVVLGRSRIVGMPVALLLSYSGCTVSLLHSASQNVPEECVTADILIAAVGKPHLVKADWVKEGATVIDVGITRVPLDKGKTQLVGDVDFEAIRPRAGAITPVPGGVGPMTVACLMVNTLKAYCLQSNLSFKPIQCSL